MHPPPPRLPLWVTVVGDVDCALPVDSERTTTDQMIIRIEIDIKTLPAFAVVGLTRSILAASSATT